MRKEKDSMGVIEVPDNVYYGAQTKRASDNFPISNIKIPFDLIHAIAIIKRSAAIVNHSLAKLDLKIKDAIVKASDEIINHKLDKNFVLDVFQTGSGTSTNMNVNEVIANRANEILGKKLGSNSPVHPNDHVNRGQSSNDTFPTAIRIAAVLEILHDLQPAIEELEQAFTAKGREYAHVVKTGRTHLMDAMPVTVEQEFGGYARQLELGRQRLYSALERMRELPMGGTAVGTGINTPPEFPPGFAKEVSRISGESFREAENHFEAQSTIDAPVELSGQLKTLAVGLLKIVNDLRWMNSGPNAGLGEIQLAALQPGSSIMPGKVNPTQSEAMTMVCCQIMGNHTAISIGGSQGNFELNVFKPMIIHNLLHSVRLVSDTCHSFADRCVIGLIANEGKIAEHLENSLMLVTALNPHIGYDNSAKIAKNAHEKGLTLRQSALELEMLTDEQFDEWVKADQMTGPSA